MRVVHALLTGILTLATSLCLTYALFGAGFVACTTPQATSFIGNTFAGWEHAIFPKDNMALIAEATRSFSIEGTSEEELYQTIYEVLAKNDTDLLESLGIDSESITSYLDTDTTTDADISSDSTSQDTATNDGIGSFLANALQSAGVSAYLEQYSLPANAISHLQDCTSLFQTGRISVGVVAAFGLVGLIALGILKGRRRIGGTCILGASLMLALLIGLAVWAVLDFNSLFIWMHTMLFSQGNWSFPSDSLLIQLFPESFWAAMAGLWILTSTLCAIVVLIVGRLLAR